MKCLQYKIEVTFQKFKAHTKVRLNQKRDSFLTTKISRIISILIFSK